MKKSLAILFVAILAFSMCLFAGAFELDAAEGTADFAATEESVLSEVIVVPGINVLTGDICIL